MAVPKKVVSDATKSLSKWALPVSSQMLVIRILALLAGLVVGYAGWVSFGGMMIIGCGAGADCLEVLRTRWAYWMGVPVSILALAVYGVLFAATFWIKDSNAASTRQKGWSVLMAGSVLLFGAAIWFVALQLLVIRRLCTICMLSHFLGFLTVTVVVSGFFKARLANPGEKLSGGPGLLITRGLPIMSLVVLSALITGQLLLPPAAHQVWKIGQGTEVASKAGRKQLHIFGGQFLIDLNEVPMIGPPQAAHVIVCLLDYTCLGCRILHGQLLEATQVFGDRLAVVCLLAPLDSACNPAVKTVYPGHTDACEYARLGLAIWQVDHSAFAEFQRWMMSSSAIPSLDEARRYAKKWVTFTATERPDLSERVQVQLNQGVSIYGIVQAKLGKDAMPQLILGDKVIMGSFRNTADLCAVLTKELGINIDENPVNPNAPKPAPNER